MEEEKNNSQLGILHDATFNQEFIQQYDAE